MTFRDPYGAFNGFPYDAKWPEAYRIVLSCFPPTLLALGMNYLDAASFFATSEGIHMGDLAGCPPGSPICVLSMVGLLDAAYLSMVRLLDSAVQSPFRCFLFPA